MMMSFGDTASATEPAEKDELPPTSGFSVDPFKWLPEVQKCRYLPQRDMVQLCNM
jgi:hypothetical protein